jgi:hypothetical protein
VRESAEVAELAEFALFGQRSTAFVLVLPFAKKIGIN